MKPWHVVAIFVAIAVICLACACCAMALTFFAAVGSQSSTANFPAVVGTIESPAVVGTAQSPETSAQQPPVSKAYKIGEVIQLQDHTIVLEKAKFNSDMLVLTFSIENTGSEVLSNSSFWSMDARNQDGTKLEQEIFDCGTSLSGQLPPGDKAKGDVCFKGSLAPPIKVYYKPDLIGSTLITWSVSP